MRLAILSNAPEQMDEAYRTYFGRAGLMDLEVVCHHDPVSELKGRLRSCDALVLTGGGDSARDSGAYAEVSEEESVRLHPVSKEREVLERLLLEWALEHRKPVLGICRGAQALNVFLKGTLMPDIELRLGSHCHPLHRAQVDVDASQRWHALALAPDSLLAGCFREGDEASASSFHHQAVDALASSFVVDARAPDGIIEAFHDRRRIDVVGWQFHPERMSGSPWIVRALCQWVSHWSR